MGLVAKQGGAPVEARAKSNEAEQIAALDDNWTGRYLRPLLGDLPFSVGDVADETEE